MKTAFIGLDYIFDIVHPDGKLSRSSGQARERSVLANANRALRISRDKGWLTALVKVGFAPGYVNQPKNSPFFGGAQKAGALELGTKGTEFHPDLDADLADVIVVKPRVSAFYGTDLESVLRPNKIERLILAGVSTAWAVQATARDAHDRDYEVIIAEDACAAASEEEHQASMRLLTQIAKVIKVADLTSL
jgi:nicotinamidase-related amidase